MRMNAWVASIMTGAACYGITLVDSALAVVALAMLLGWMAASQHADGTEVLDELDRIRKTQLVQVYDGGDEDEASSSI